MDFKTYRNQPFDELSTYMHNIVRKDNVDTIYERFAEQQPQCAFGAMGVCCTLCTDGPCQITRKAKRGVCGASADLMVARNLLLKCAQGVGANVYHARNVARTLKAIGEGKADYNIKDEAKLRSVAKKFGIDEKQTTKKLAKDVGSFYIDQINSNDYEPLKVVEYLAPEKRKKVWKKLDIFPGGPNSEIATGLSKAATNFNNDPVDILLHCLRLGIANEYCGLFGATYLQEILVGTASPVQCDVNIGVLDSDSVNLVMHGHQPLLAVKVFEHAREKRWQEKAKKAGAKNGLKIYGTVCEGQSLFNIAKDYKDVYHGPVGNWSQQELILATGAVDCLAFDYNCVMPTLSEVFAPKYHTKLISTDKTLRHAGVERLEFEPDKAAEIAEKILEKAVEAFGKRGKINIPSVKYSAMAGFTTESVMDALGGSLKPLIDAISGNTIKGVAAVVGCTTVREFQSGRHIVNLTMELIKRNILVIGAGCCSSVIQNASLMSPGSEAVKDTGKGLASVCSSLGIPPCLNYGGCPDIGKIVGTTVALAEALNVDIPDLPVVASAPEYMEQKALADAFTAVALGFAIHVAPAPPVLGSPTVAKILTQDVESLTGGKVIVELDPVKSADAMETHIMNKRKRLGLTTEAITANK